MRFAFDRSAVQTTFALVAILSLAAHVRFLGVYWDQLTGMHPDERHMIFVTFDMFRALADPANSGLDLWGWWLSEASPLNPHLGERSYVYGEAPLLIGMLAGWWSGNTEWFDFMRLGRQLAVLADTATVLAVFGAARHVSGRSGALAAAILYAAMPTALQLANFHTVDVWLTLAVTTALIPLLALGTGRTGWIGPTGHALLAGAMIGLAAAAKIPGLVMLVPAAIAFGLVARRKQSIGQTMLLVLPLLFGLFVAFRLANPFAFDGISLGGLGLSEAWKKDFEGLAEVTASPHFPPNWQWIAGYGTLRLTRDVAMFGVGPVATLMLILLVLRHKGGWGALVLPLTVFAVFFIGAMISSVSALRYAAPGFAALAIALSPMLQSMRPMRVLLTLGLALWWGAGAVRLHDGQHPRVAASVWLWSLPKGTVLTNETDWDETLPVIVSLGPGEERRWPSHDDWFVFQMLGISDPDSPEKAARMAETLARTDFLILSSDRHQAVMPRLPKRFPMTTAHYAALLDGTACFAPVLVIDRGYMLPGLRFGDSWAQEPWRVYDHPIVRIFRREPCFDESRYKAFLTASLEPG